MPGDSSTINRSHGLEESTIWTEILTPSETHPTMVGFNRNTSFQYGYSATNLDGELGDPDREDFGFWQHNAIAQTSLGKTARDFAVGVFYTGSKVQRSVSHYPAIAFSYRWRIKNHNILFGQNVSLHIKQNVATTTGRQPDPELSTSLGIGYNFRGLLVNFTFIDPWELFKEDPEDIGYWAFANYYAYHFKIGNSIRLIPNILLVQTRKFADHIPNFWVNPGLAVDYKNSVMVAVNFPRTRQYRFDISGELFSQFRLGLFFEGVITEDHVTDKRTPMVGGSLRFRFNAQTK